MPERRLAARPRLSSPPWAKVDRVPLIRREIREHLSSGALEVLFGHAERVVEAGREHGEGVGAGARVYATAMVTIDLRRYAKFFREPPDAATAERVAELMDGNAEVRRRLEGLVRAELARVADVPPATLEVSVEPRVRADGPMVLIDGDAMGRVKSRAVRR